MRNVTAVVFHAPLGPSPVERMIERGRCAAALDLLERLHWAGADRIRLVSSDRGIDLGMLSHPVKRVHVSDEAFHFGRTLQAIIQDERPDGVVLLGSGSAPLLQVSHMNRLVAFARGNRPAALFNNFYSCDFASIACAETLLPLDLPSHDNPLGFALADAGIPCHALPRSAESQFDIDTPTDLLLLSLVDHGGRHLRATIDEMSLEHPHLADILSMLTDRSATLSLIGRINPTTWSLFEREVACRTSGLIEGRGMRSAHGDGIPVLHQVIAADGPRAFFARLARSCDAALIDTRPLLSTGKTLPSADVRFNSDLLRPEAIADPGWRTFTEAALESRIPILLGGHSLVSGGLYLLAKACWKGRDLPRRLHPDPYDWEKE